MTRSFGRGVVALGLMSLGSCVGQARAAGNGWVSVRRTTDTVYSVGPAPAAPAAPAAGKTPATKKPSADPIQAFHDARAARFCPPYGRSDLYRRRSHTVRVRPGDDWIAAVQNAGPGTEVVFAKGEYRFGHTLNVNIGDDVTLRGETGDPKDVVLRGDGYDIECEGLTVRGSNVTIADLSVADVRDHAVMIKGEDGAQAPNIYDVRLFDTGTQQIKLTPGNIQDGVIACSEIFFHPGAAKGDYVDAIDLHNAINWKIRDNYIHDIEGDHTGCDVDISCQTYDSGPAILVWNQSSGTVVERNLLLDNFRNIAFGLARGHEGGIIRNNFIYRTKDGDAGIELETAENTRVVNNTVRLGGYDKPMEVRQSHGIELVNNLMQGDVWDRGDADFHERGDLHDASDADFLSPGDFRLKKGSRAIGAGVADAAAPEDIDGQKRGKRNDVGCDQAN
jgi:hypothetical protein